MRTLFWSYLGESFIVETLHRNKKGRRVRGDGCLTPATVCKREYFATIILHPPSIFYTTIEAARRCLKPLVYGTVSSESKSMMRIDSKLRLTFVAMFLDR